MTQGPPADVQAAHHARQGNDAWTQGKIADAVNGFARAALLNPLRAEYHINLGVALRKIGRVDASIACYQRALALRPNDPVTYSNLGNSYRDAGRLDEAEDALRLACQLSPHSQSYLYNLALVIRDRRRHREARDILQSILDQDPNNADVAWDIALTDLYLCDYAAGWRGYETRWRLDRSVPRNFSGPQWRPGMPLENKVLLIVAEQGFGDSLQFARFLPRLAEAGAKLVIECQPELQDLLSTLPGVVQTIAKHTPPPAYDYWLPIMSLAWVLGISYPSLPGIYPYLSAPAGKTVTLPPLPGVRKNIGLIWAGKTTPRDRSWPLPMLAPLLNDPRLAFWSLQMGERADDLASTGMGALIRDLRPQIKSFADTAAIMQTLDLIITIDTSACHLAGALGRPTWVLLRYVSDWRWLDDPEDSAWYPSMRLFRQTDPHDFSGPVDRMRQALAIWADHATGLE